MAYGPVPGPEPQLRSAVFGAWTNLKIAKQLVTGRGPVHATRGLPRRSVLDAVLQRGAACLAG
jgi:hypothetical protein